MTPAYSWVPIRGAAAGEVRLRLFCLPYAGGSATAYLRWKAALPAGVELCAIELPGHGTRLRQPPSTRIEALVEALATGLREELDRPFALFGHSMGGLLGFELAHELQRRHGVSPVHLFVSAARAPQLALPEADRLHQLPDPELLDALRRLDGSPAAALDNAELMEIMLPVIRADLAACETYQYLERAPLPCPITAFAGSADPLASPAEVDQWRRHTGSGFTLRTLADGHWYLDRPDLLRSVTDVLQPLACRG